MIWNAHIPAVEIASPRSEHVAEPEPSFEHTRHVVCPESNPRYTTFVFADGSREVATIPAEAYFSTDTAAARSSAPFVLNW